MREAGSGCVIPPKPAALVIVRSAVGLRGHDVCATRKHRVTSKNFTYAPPNQNAKAQTLRSNPAAT
jgi:hypothetical protein